MTATTASMDYASLLESLEEETRLLIDVYRAARRQRRHMLRRRVAEMREQVGTIEELLPRVKAAGRRREILLVTAGMIPRAGRSVLKEWLGSVEEPWKERLQSALESLSRVGGRLQSLNFQNFQLARFSMDLAQEEIRILVGEDQVPGSYDSEGDVTRDGGHGVVDGRA